MSAFRKTEVVGREGAGGYAVEVDVTTSDPEFEDPGVFLTLDPDGWGDVVEKVLSPEEARRLSIALRQAADAVDPEDDR